MATGGVTNAEIGAYLEAGAAVVGLGGSLPVSNRAPWNFLQRPKETQCFIDFSFSGIWRRQTDVTQSRDGDSLRPETTSMKPVLNRDVVGPESRNRLHG